MMGSLGAHRQGRLDCRNRQLIPECDVGKNVALGDRAEYSRHRVTVD